MIKKVAYYSNPFIGLFFEANKDFCLMPLDTPNKARIAIEEALDVTPIILSIGESNLIGIYSVMLDDVVIVPPILEENEKKKLAEHGLEIFVFDTKLNALSNNIVINKKAAIMNPRFSDKERKAIEDMLGVEVFSFPIAQYTSIGSLIHTNGRGFLISYVANDEELRKVEAVLGIYGIKGSVNMGSRFVGIGIVSNQKGAIVGKESTGIEIARIMEALDLVEVE